MVRGIIVGANLILFSSVSLGRMDNSVAIVCGMTKVAFFDVIVYFIDFVNVIHFFRAEYPQ